MKAVVVLPTYNESENIQKLITTILLQEKSILNTSLSVLVVDDTSPDGTGEIVKSLAKKDSRIHLITGKKEGLGRAYIRGFKYALSVLKADVIFEMDADFSHNPYDIPRLLNEIHTGSDFVIGSRYIQGGSIPKEWSFLRKLNSIVGNRLTRYIHDIRDVRDCTGGFRAIRSSLLKKISFNSIKVNGYAFQISLLLLAREHDASISEVPVQFVDRARGVSKIQLKDILEFGYYVFSSKFPILPLALYFLLFMGIGFIAGMTFLILISSNFFSLLSLPTIVILCIAILLIVQSIYSLYLLVYAWDEPSRISENRGPDTFEPPKHSFSILIPARHEEAVIGHTLQAFSKLSYPKHLREIIVICRTDDIETITKVKETIDALDEKSIQLVLFSDYPINKPHSLNIGLQKASKEIVAVFDAEDEPHKDILHVMNTLFYQTTGRCHPRGSPAHELHNELVLNL